MFTIWLLNFRVEVAVATVALAKGWLKDLVQKSTTHHSHCIEEHFLMLRQLC